MDSRIEAACAAAAEWPVEEGTVPNETARTAVEGLLLQFSALEKVEIEVDPNITGGIDIGLFPRGLSPFALITCHNSGIITWAAWHDGDSRKSGVIAYGEPIPEIIRQILSGAE